MMTNYGAITARITPFTAVFLPSFAGGCSEARLAKAQEFFSQPEHSPLSTPKELEKTAAAVHDCVRLNEREGPAVKRYLSQFAPKR